MPLTLFRLVFSSVHLRQLFIPGLNGALEMSTVN